MYVRNITFSGSNRINDEVLRREMRQLEGGWLSNTSLERSKQRIQRLPYVKTVDFETTPVTGAPDLVDVNYKIEEGPSAQLGGGIGYSETYKFQLNGSYSDANFLGTGQRVAVELNGGAFSKVYSIQETNPYTTVDNVQRTISLTYRDVTQFVSSSSNFSSKTLSVGPTWAYPLTEFQFVRFGAVFESSQLLTSSLGSALQAQQWVQQNGHPYSARRPRRLARTTSTFSTARTSRTSSSSPAGIGIPVTARCSPIAARGSPPSISSTMPGADVEYYVANANFVHYVPITHGFTFVSNNGVDYGEPFGHTTAIPPYRQFFGGGPDNVRGYRESRLGPTDQFGNPYGGNMRITSQNELIFPMPAKWRSSARVSAFFDMGGVYETGSKLQFYGPDGVTPESYRLTEWSDIRRSVGVAVQWLAPLGLFRFSLGVPLNAQHGDANSPSGATRPRSSSSRSARPSSERPVFER